MRKLKDLCEIAYGKGLPERERRPGPVTVYGSAGAVGTHVEALEQEPIIVVGRKGNISGVYLSDGPSWVIDTAYALKPSPALDRHYLYHFLKFQTSHLAASDQSTAIPSLAREVLYSLELNLPPLTEQKETVRKISALFADIDSGTQELDRTKAKLELYKQSVLNAAIRGKLVPQDPNDKPASKLLERIRAEKEALIKAGKLKKEKPLPPVSPDEIPFELPKGWEWVSLREIATIQGGIQKQPKRAPRNHFYPFLRVANVLKDRLDLAEVHSVELFEGELERLRLQKDDLLIVEGNGSPNEIGRMAVWDGSMENCVHQNHLIRARLLGDVSPRYLVAVWNSLFGRSQLLSMAGSTSGLYTLSVSKISGFCIPLPPREEQNRISTELSRLIALLKDLTDSSKVSSLSSETLRQSILKSAFEGRLV